MASYPEPQHVTSGPRSSTKVLPFLNSTMKTIFHVLDGLVTTWPGASRRITPDLEALSCFWLKLVEIIEAKIEGVTNDPMDQTKSGHLMVIGPLALSTIGIPAIDGNSRVLMRHQPFNASQQLTPLVYLDTRDLKEGQIVYCLPILERFAEKAEPFVKSVQPLLLGLVLIRNKDNIFQRIGIFRVEEAGYYREGGIKEFWAQCGTSAGQNDKKTTNQLKPTIINGQDIPQYKIRII